MFRPCLLAVAAAALLFASQAAASRCICGDSDCSGVVSSFDALAAMRSAVGLVSICDRNCNCDTDSSRQITTSDALDILRSATGSQNSNGGCGFIDECLYDEDCADGYECGDNPEWLCDFVCVPRPTTTTLPIAADECFEDFDCWDDNPGWYCRGTDAVCVECMQHDHCTDSMICAGFVCVPE